ncbi:hypothetical protein PR048_012006 [Dryococelus australis]|uniref:Novel acetylcholine receptor chaperone n=1 Tax=Dryococelus australis TaxID=614101 RepID=A0ABQ9HN90_9NEOP|nr:hypothetical protein PR048_012006 [Dryococelus australis]
MGEGWYDSLYLWSIVVKILSIVSHLFLIFLPFMILSCLINRKLHCIAYETWNYFPKLLPTLLGTCRPRKEYVKYAKVFPFADLLDIKVPSKWYRRVVGSLEIICGLAMAFVPSNTVKQGANIVLLVLMMMAVYSHYMVNDKFERTAPALIGYFMKTVRLFIYLPISNKQLELIASTQLTL